MVTGILGRGTTQSLLVGGSNPSEKYARQIGSFLQVGGEKKNIFETTT